jgi:hypothetical protein
VKIERWNLKERKLRGIERWKIERNLKSGKLKGI